ncbi:MAG: helix-turn-helix domain-containing protein [Planctomycetaceae bacterium]|nr:helix-turn-helix domain-containing protein [Planctomycetaceae bacterium]
MSPKSVASALQRPVETPLADRLTWSLKDAARSTGLSIRTLQSAISRGDLAAIRVGRRVLLSPDAVRAWLASLSTVAD